MFYFQEKQACVTKAGFKNEQNENGGLGLPQVRLCYGLRREPQTTICWRWNRVSAVLREAALLKGLRLSSAETCFSSSENNQLIKGANRLSLSFNGGSQTGVWSCQQVHIRLDLHIWLTGCWLSLWGFIFSCVLNKFPYFCITHWESWGVVLYWSRYSEINIFLFCTERICCLSKIDRVGRDAAVERVTSDKTAWAFSWLCHVSGFTSDVLALPRLIKYRRFCHDLEQKSFQILFFSLIRYD